MSSALERPTGTVTFLFTDIEGSTRLLKQLRDAYATALTDHQRIVRGALAANDGWEIDTQGDSFFAAFRRAKDAVAAAVDIQRTLAAHDWPEDTQLRVRMGIHTGEPAVGGERYVGLGVHRAARIAAAGHGGQVLVSATTRELLRDDPPPDVTLRDLGEHQLKDMDEPERIYQLVAPGLDEDFAPLKTAAPALATGSALVEAAEDTVAEMRRPWRRDRRVVAGAVAAAVVVAALLAVALTRGGSASASGEIAANNVGVLDLSSAKVESSIPVGDSPSAAAADGDAVWVANTDANSVSRIDPKTNDVRQTIDVGNSPSGIAVGGGSVWVANGLDGTLSRIGGNSVTQTADVGNGPAGVAFGAGSVWVANAVDGTIVRVDAGTGRVTKTIAALDGVSAVAYGAERLWAAVPPSATVLEIDPQSGRIVDRIGVNDPVAVAVGGGAVWVADRSDGTLNRIEPRGGGVTDTIAVGREPVALAADRDGVWVANSGNSTISKIDPDQVRVVRTVKLDNPPAGLALTPGGVYVSVRGSGAAHRGGTLRVVSQGVDFLDPALAYEAETWAILTSTNDGLVAFRRVGGIQGLTLVPDLAASLPEPTDGGKTWTFRLRPDIHYSNGRPVQPQDVRRSIERLFLVKPASFGAQYYTSIVGAARCSARHCDLSHGIEADPIGRTVTFRLRAPDADFLTKLALPFAYVVPASTPARDQEQHRVPATGPYVIVARKKDHVVLERNKSFREWSSEAQPDGFPDRIVWDYAQDADAGIKAVVGGRADVYNRFPPAVTKQQVDELVARHPGQVHFSTAAVTNYWFLNTRVPPFDDVRVRLAVNYAYDRQQFASSLGRTVAPTCQILPPNFPSYHKFCPYLPNGAAGLDKARRLVRASGTAGARVQVWVQKPLAAQADFFAGVLKSLGYRARLHSLDPTKYWRKILDSRTRAQTGFNGWVSDFPSESGFLSAQFLCSDFTPANPDKSSDPSELCDPTVDRLIVRAAAVQAINPPASRAIWQAAERKILADAAVVPMYNRQDIDFLAKRVGNYQVHPQWGTLIDQLWVK